MRDDDRRRSGAPNLSKWQVVAYWPRQAGFSIVVEAEDEAHARRLAEDAARSCGWTVSRPNRIDVLRVNSNRKAVVKQQ